MPPITARDVIAKADTLVSRRGHTIKIGPETLDIVILALRRYALDLSEAAADRHAGDHYRVDEWSDDGNRVLERLATGCNLTIAEAAYDAALLVRPRSEITLRHGIRIIAKRKSGG